MPMTPQQVAGLRTDPPVSVPSAPGARPVATATAEPLEEPPGWRSRFHGLSAAGHGNSRVGPPVANSCKASLPSSTAPASRSRVTTVASAAARWLMRSLEWQVVAIPATSKMSFNA